jgi:hypothetical protein
MATTTSTSTMTDHSIATAMDNHPPASLHHRKPTEPKANGNGHANGSTTQRIRDTKYRHVFATHSLTRTSCLSQDSESSPSFVGFRNLMVLVLSMHSPPGTVRTQLIASSRLQSAIDDCELAKGMSCDIPTPTQLTGAVWRPHLHQLPRLFTLRHQHRPAPLLPRTRLSVRYIPHRARCSMASETSICPHIQGRGQRQPCQICGCVAELQLDVVHRGLFP